MGRKKFIYHPEVYISRNKDTRYFEKEKSYSKGVEWYESFFKNAKEKAIVEAPVGCLRNSNAPKRIHQLIPDVNSLPR